MYQNKRGRPEASPLDISPRSNISCHLSSLIIIYSKAVIPAWMKIYVGDLQIDV